MEALYPDALHITCGGPNAGPTGSTATGGFAFLPSSTLGVVNAMRSDQRLTTGDVEAIAGQALSRVVGARLLEEKDRNQVFAVGEKAILKAYLRDGAARLSAYVLPRARAAHAEATTLDMVPRALLRRAGQELDRLVPAICAADGMRPSLVHGDYGTSNVALARASDGTWQVAAVFDFESAAPGDPVEDFVWTADHGLDSRTFQAFLAGYLEHGWLDADAPQRLAFYQLEHCLGVLGWAWQADRPWFAQAQRLIEQVLDGARMRLPAEHRPGWAQLR